MALSEEPGFTGSIVPGELLEPHLGFGNGMSPVTNKDKDINGDNSESDSKNEGEGDIDEDAIRIYTAIGE